jgi:hypothetical protein
MSPGIAPDKSRCCGAPDECCSPLMCARTSWASVILLASRTWRKVALASANLLVFHSMLPALAMANLSPVMRRRAFGISTPDIPKKFINCVPRLNAPAHRGQVVDRSERLRVTQEVVVAVWAPIPLRPPARPNAVISAMRLLISGLSPTPPPAKSVWIAPGATRNHSPMFAFPIGAWFPPSELPNIGSPLPLRSYHASVLHGVPFCREDDLPAELLLVGTI